MIVEIFKKNLKPEPVMTVSEWADEHRVLTSDTSAEPGRWTTSRTPYLKEIMDELSPYTRTHKVVFMKSAQVGGALALDTILPTPEGFTTMGEVQPGDVLLDEKGYRTKVRGVSEIFTDHTCYEMSFMSRDGKCRESIVCDHVHIWPVLCGTKYYNLKVPDMLKWCEKKDGVYHSRLTIGAMGNYWWLATIREIPTVPTKCIEVDSWKHLFLCGLHGIPTHNTECGLNWLGYTIDHSPAPMLMVQPTLDMTKKYSKKRVDPMINASERLMDKVAKVKSRDSGNTIFQKDFAGGTLIFSGANAAASLRSMPAERVFFDEVDAYPLDLDGEGSPIELGLARQKTFPKRKAFINSTPTLEDQSEIQKWYQRSTQGHFYVPCPECSHEFVFDFFKGLKWPEGRPEAARYHCPECGYEIRNEEKTRMLAEGQWVHTYPERDVKGYHINALYAPVGWVSWAEIASEYEKAQEEYRRLGSDVKIKTFYNTTLGLAYQQLLEMPDWRRVYERRRLYEIGKIPKGGLFLTAGVDVQQDRLEVEIVAWGRDRVSWSIEYLVLNGDTAQREVWAQLRAVLNKRYELEGAQSRVPIAVMCIDSGFRSQHVYQFVRSCGQPNRVTAIKGVDTLMTPLGTARPADVRIDGKIIRRGLKVYQVGVSALKEEFYADLNVPAQTPILPGYCHFPEYDESYFRMLVSEAVQIKVAAGKRPKRIWVKVHERNEALDCRVYARAAASIYGIDRFSNETWDRLEREVYQPLLFPDVSETPRPQALKAKLKPELEKQAEKVDNTKKSRKRREDSIW